MASFTDCKIGHGLASIGSIKMQTFMHRSEQKKDISNLQLCKITSQLLSSPDNAGVPDTVSREAADSL